MDRAVVRWVGVAKPTGDRSLDFHAETLDLLVMSRGFWDVIGYSFEHTAQRGTASEDG